jgi:hypothetical protein
LWQRTAQLLTTLFVNKFRFADYPDTTWNRLNRESSLDVAQRRGSRALDVQGYRLDHVQAISTDFFLDLLNQPDIRARFAVGEYRPKLLLRCR